MKKNLQLTAIGNALIDLEYQIDYEVLDDLKLPKGEMRHTTHSHQKEIINKLNYKTFNQSSGGSAANTIISFRKFGGKSAYMTSLGNDDYGKIFKNEFLEHDIHLEAKIINSMPTGVCLVLITPDAERTMLTALGASSQFSIENLNEEIIKNSEWIYIEGYQLSTPQSAIACLEAAKFAKKASTKTAITFSDVFIIENYRETLEQLVSFSDLIFCNEAEALSFTRTNDIESAIKILSNQVPKFVITLGEKGSIIKWNKKLIDIPAYKVKPIDTTGAGDIYAGAFLYGIIHSGNPEKAGYMASYSSSRVITQMGAKLKDDHSKISQKFL